MSFGLGSLSLANGGNVGIGLGSMGSKRARIIFGLGNRSVPRRTGRIALSSRIRVGWGGIDWGGGKLRAVDFYCLLRNA